MSEKEVLAQRFEEHRSHLRAVASQAITFARFAEAAHAVLVNGVPGVVAMAEGRALSVMAFTVQDGRITALDILTDPERLARIDLSVVRGG
ncbi:hypothetical protein [Streptomyces virginiae]|uniref:hypothetical protein n=1 Tax=Streptomyces virginiae TaxID=1961 RepID=UPI003866EFFF